MRIDQYGDFMGTPRELVMALPTLMAPSRTLTINIWAKQVGISRDQIRRLRTMDRDARSAWLDRYYPQLDLDLD